MGEGSEENPCAKVRHVDHLALPSDALPNAAPPTHRAAAEGCSHGGKPNDSGQARQKLGRGSGGGFHICVDYVHRTPQPARHPQCPENPTSASNATVITIAIRSTWKSGESRGVGRLLGRSAEPPRRNGKEEKVREETPAVVRGDATAH